MSTTKQHVCFGQKHCTNCDKVVPMDHMCFIKQVDPISKTKFKGLGFFDFEAYDSPCGKQIVNLAMAKRVCKTCYEGEAACLLCDRKYMFHDIESFVNWLKADGKKDFIWFAHNAK